MGRGNVRLQIAGFTLVEAQVAVVLFVLVMLILLGHGGVFYGLLGWLENDRRVVGIADVAGQRLVLAVSGTGAEAAPPPCRVELLSIDTAGPYPSAEVRISPRTF